MILSTFRPHSTDRIRIKYSKLEIIQIESSNYLPMRFYLSFITLAIVSSTLTSCKKTTDDRTDFVSSYGVTETWTENGKMLTKSVFFMPVYKSSLISNGLLLWNFANYGNSIAVEATVSGNTISISQQALSNSRTIVGTGSIDGSGTLTFAYFESYGNSLNSVSAIAKKR